MSSKKILFVLTSHNDLGGVRPTGFFVGEAVHPWLVFKDAGFTVDLASVKGGQPPQDGRDEKDPDQQAFFNDPHIAEQLENTPKASEVDASEYDAVFFVGGHGTMWDFPNDDGVARIGRDVYENDGVVAAVCHGPSALVNMTLSDGAALVAGKKVAGFTNDEEIAVELHNVVPFSLADTLEARGATHIPGPNFTEQVVVDGRLVTGQNPQSAAGVARETIEVLASLQK